MTGRARTVLVTLERSSVTEDDYNEQTEAWTSLGTEWAQVFYGRGDERRQAASQQDRQPATFQVLMNEITRSLTVKDRLTDDGTIWDIRGLAPDTPKRGQIEITAVRGS